MRTSSWFSGQAVVPAAHMQSDPGIITVGFGPGLAVSRDVLRDAHDLRGTSDISAADVVVLDGDRPPTGPVHGSVLLVGGHFAGNPAHQHLRTVGREGRTPVGPAPVGHHRLIAGREIEHDNLLVGVVVRDRR